MFKVLVPDSIIKHAEDQVARYNFGNRRTANGTREQQKIGVIGQSVVSGLFGLGPVDGSKGCDDGVDIRFEGLSVDVKTMGRTTDVRPYYVSNFLAVQLHFRTDVLVFCSFNKTDRVLTVCGWCPKAELYQKAKTYPKGSVRTRSDGSTFVTFADLLEIEISALHDVASAADLKVQLARIRPTLA